MGYGMLLLLDGKNNVPEAGACEDTSVPKETLGDTDCVAVITDVKERVDPDPVPVAPITLEVKLRGNGGIEELGGAPDESPEECGEVPVGMIEEWVLGFDLVLDVLG
jgi:hypothetical protein